MHNKGIFCKQKNVEKMILGNIRFANREPLRMRFKAQSHYQNIMLVLRTLYHYANVITTGMHVFS